MLPVRLCSCCITTNHSYTHPDERKVAGDGLLHDVVGAVEVLQRTRLALDLDLARLAALLVLDGGTALVDHCVAWDTE